MTDGEGNPNAEGGAYSDAAGQPYALSYTIKISKLGKTTPDGYFEYVMPLLEELR